MRFNMKSGAAASPFAGLFRSGPKVSAKKAEDDKKDEEMESPEDGDEKDKDDDKEKGKKAKAEKSDEECAEDDEEEARAESEDDDKDEKKDEKAKAVAAERTRWVSVLSSDAAAGKGEAACTMLAETDMSAKQITSVLKGLPGAEAKSGRRSLDERMASRTQVNPGAGGDEKPAEGPQATAAAMRSVYDRLVGRSK